ncbi:SPEF1 protein, partial [Amia calva]|nr:SPEF1 protein [Amia calva]
MIFDRGPFTDCKVERCFVGSRGAVQMREGVRDGSFWVCLWLQLSQTLLWCLSPLRKVFNRLNFSVPEEVVRKVVQCSPGVVEVVLHSLRQKMEEKLKQRVNKQSSQELEYYSTESGQGAQSSTYSPQPKLTRDSNQIQHSPGPGYSQPPASPDTSARLLLEEREQALLSAQETIAILQAKVNRLQHLLHLKDIRIDELSRRLQLPQKSN